ncbi:MAG TPA: hypothetical protein VK636_01670 [Gemmatimonadaceae bacterium]|nr:hypothetical protein [Gemmatimonadaceae bacterium]
MTAPRVVRTSLDEGAVHEARAAVREANLAFATRYPGESDSPQPVHTLIEGAQYFTADVAARRGAHALLALDDFAPDTATFADVFGIPGHRAVNAVEQRVRDKLSTDPVEDYRIDFEDGYGVRADADEDRDAVAVAAEIAFGRRDGTLPASIGMRMKPLTEELRERSVRTLDLLLTALVEQGGIPARWVITVPKITVIEQVDYVVAVLRSLERALGLTNRTLVFEIMVEVPQVILDATGQSLLPRMLDASDGRLRGIDFGTYDYTAGCGITAAYQRLRHPACDFAKHAMQVAFAGTGIRISDGSTQLLPVPTHVAPADGTFLTERQRAENTKRVHDAWKLHFDDVRHGLAGGFYQGWDLHPAQLVSRYAAVASFFLEGVEIAGARLQSFLTKAASASLVGGVLDEPATGQGLLGFFLRGIQAGAITQSEAMQLTGLSAAEMRERSILKIMRGRGVLAPDSASPR